ncbi:hypothetical protein AB0395_24285 [Streptosporangium sp. NPDC051023]|uniref:hypothetical protein n=1 Tax=Streptosporangium sp. NPDC051023 TaxID=3155410 RepID=UPI00344CDE9B
MRIRILAAAVMTTGALMTTLTGAASADTPSPVPSTETSDPAAILASPSQGLVVDPQSPGLGGGVYAIRCEGGKLSVRSYKITEEELKKFDTLKEDMKLKEGGLKAVPDGPILKQAPDGSVFKVAPDEQGSDPARPGVEKRVEEWKVAPDGSVLKEGPDGSVFKVAPDEQDSDPARPGVAEKDGTLQDHVGSALSPSIPSEVPTAVPAPRLDEVTPDASSGATAEVPAAPLPELSGKIGPGGGVILESKDGEVTITKMMGADEKGVTSPEGDLLLTCSSISPEKH